MAELFAVLLVANGALLIATGAALARDRRTDEPDYMPRHTLVPVTDELTRAVNAKRRALRRHPAPWSQPPIRHESEPATIEEIPVTNLPDVVYKVFWTAVAAILGYLSTVQVDVGPEWTPIVAAIYTAVLVAVRQWVDKRNSTPAT